MPGMFQATSGPETNIWEERGEAAVTEIERFAFYEKAKEAYAIIATGETAMYANSATEGYYTVKTERRHFHGRKTKGIP